MNAMEIIDYIKQCGRIEIPSMQLQLGITYKEAKSIVDDLLEKCQLVYENGLSYVYLETLDKNSEEKSDEEQDNDEEDEDEEDEEEDFDDEYESEFEKFLEEQDEYENDDEEDKKKFKAHIDESETQDIYKAFRRAKTFNDIESHIRRISAKRREAIQNLDNVLDKLILEKQKPISANYRPQHTLWEDGLEFMEAVDERLERLIKSDRKMGRKGAIKKASAYLEAVKDTCDGKMAQVYERLVYEIINTSDYTYAQMKKQIWE